MDITRYIDFNTEIDPTVLQDVETRLRAVLKQKWESLDTSPSSVFGNLFITPAARVVAMIEQSTDCILADLNLENAINGVVCDCDFIQTFLKGLGVSSLQEVNTTGMVRFHFINLPDYVKYGDTAIEFDQGELLLFSDLYVFNFIAGNNPTIRVYGPNANIDIDKQNNVYKLSKADATLSPDYPDNTETVNYFVDLPVYGPATAEVLTGSLGKIDENFGVPIDNIPLTTKYIRQVEMLHDVTPLQLPSTLDELIDLTRKILPAASLSTRANAMSYITHRFPSLKGASMVLAQDKPEMQRSENTINNPLVDLYIKGPHTIECVEYFSVNEKDYENSPETLSNLGTFQHIPLVITSVIPVVDRDQQVDQTYSTYVGRNASNLIQCEGLRSSSTLLAAAGDSVDQSYDAVILKGTDKDQNIQNYKLTLDGVGDAVHLSIEKLVETDIPNSVELVALQNTNTGSLYNTTVSQGATLRFTKQMTGIEKFNTENLQYTYLGTDSPKYVKITYLYDPVAEAVIKYIKGPSCAPAFDLKVCPFITANVRELKIEYRKTAGKFFDRQKAITELYNFITSLTYPTIYDDAYIGDIMITCGASGIYSITAEVDYQISGATGGYTSEEVVCETKSLSLESLDDKDIKNYYGIGPRNINYIIPNRENIVLVERNTVHA